MLDVGLSYLDGKIFFRKSSWLKTLKTILVISKLVLFIILLLAIISAFIYSFKTPSNDLQWVKGHERNTTVLIDKHQHVTINNLRDIDWLSVQDNFYEDNNKFYSSLQFDLSELKALKVAVSHFSIINELAHVFLMFELKNNKRFGFSIEARREKGEDYTLLGGLLAKYELTYLIASENDLLGLRKMRDEKIYLYPVKITSDRVQQLFRIISIKTNEINQDPEFYHLFLKNCTTQTVNLVDQISNHKYPKLIQAFMPGDTGEGLYKMGLIETTAKSFDDVQKAALVK